MYPYAIAPLPRPGPALRLLLGTTVGVTLAQFLIGAPFVRHFALSRSGMAAGEVWQLVTYLFLHGGVMHLLMNMLGLYFFGRELETALGTRPFVRLYLFCGAVAGLGWLALSGHGAVCLGASGAVFGIVGMYAALYPRRRVTLLLFLVVPVNLSARAMALGFMGVSLLLMFDGGSGVAHAAHLVGGATGYGLGWLTTHGGGPRGLASLWGGLRAGRRRRGFAVLHGESALHGEDGRRRAGDAMADDGPVPDGATVDAILDKITREGIGALTSAERAVLDRAARRN